LNAPHESQYQSWRARLHGFFDVRVLQMSRRNLSIQTREDPSPDDIRLLVGQLATFNRERAGPSEHRPLAVFLHDGSELVGGVAGYTHWKWLFVSHLWVAQSLRRSGWGRRLMKEMETAAARRGCRAAHLDTFSFQALEFYEKLGYRRFGILPDYPPGESRYFLCKELT
jgi:ribosomal protein S18 acetylase RimI-like enzyme